MTALPKATDPISPPIPPEVNPLKMLKVVDTPASGWAGAVFERSPRYPPRRVNTQGLL